MSMNAPGKRRDETHLYIILNPYAGRKRGAQIKPRIEAALHKANRSFELVETTGCGHAVDLAQAASKAGHAIIVAAGGDGTISEVINGMAHAAQPNCPVGKLGLIPIGSGNDFAAVLGYTSNLEQTVHTLATGNTRRCDLGKATILAQGQQSVRYFGNNLGVGFEAQVAIESSQIRRVRGPLLYVIATLFALRSYRSPAVQLTWQAANGVWHEQRKAVLLISVGNSPRMGGGFYMTPNAQLDDGLLALGIANALSRLRILHLLPKVLRGTHVADPAFLLTQARQIRITAQAELPLQLDGELVTANVDALEITLLPKVLEVIV